MEKKRELVRRSDVDELIDGIAGVALTHLSSLPARCAPRGDLAIRRSIERALCPGASSLAWAPSHARRFTAHRSARNKRMLGFQGPAQPSPALGDALNAGYRYLEVKCLGCSTHQTVALDIVRRPKSTPVHELERYMRCKDCSEVRGYRYKRSHLVALRTTKISASDPPSHWWPGER